jgi:hypothetical protein
VNYFDIASYFDRLTYGGLPEIGIHPRTWFRIRKLVDTRSLRHPTTRPMRSEPACWPSSASLAPDYGYETAQAAVFTSSCRA